MLPATQGEWDSDEQWGHDGIDEHDDCWEDDWECRIIDGESGGRIRDTGEHVDIGDGSDVSTGMGWMGWGRDGEWWWHGRSGMDGGDGTGDWRDGERQVNG